MSVTASQIRAARGLLGWSQSELAITSGLGVATVKRFEASAGAQGSEQTVDAMRHALESAGVQFIAANGGGVGVRLKQRR